MGDDSFVAHRAYPTDCATNKPFLFNDRFIVRSRFVVDGDINFPPDPEFVSKEYRTVFGPTFKNTSQSYLCNNNGIRGCVRRITCAREPGIPGLHWLLIRNQYNFAGGVAAAIWKVHFMRELYDLLPIVDADEMRNVWTDAEHPKRKLRQRTRNMIANSGRVAHQTWVDAVEYKPKPGETLKVDAYLRGVGDLTAPGSCRLGYFMDLVKSAFAKRYTYLGGICEHVKAPELSVLARVFGELILPTSRVYFPYFSDDSCVSIVASDGVFRANVDISKCDGSNFDPVFDLLQSAMTVDARFNFDVDGAFKQLLLPFFVRSTQRHKVVFRPRGKVLYSGSVLTTSVNNMANTLIFLSIMTQLEILENRGFRVTLAECEELVRNSARLAGYLVTCQVCEHFENIQFLKHSPMFTPAGELMPTLNFGVIMRNFGNCRYDLPGKSKDGLELRALKYTCDVVASFVHAGDNVIFEAFRARFPHGKAIDELAVKSVNASNFLQKAVSIESIARRYGVSPVDVESFVYTVRSCRFEHSYRDRFIDACMEQDYDL